MNQHGNMTACHFFSQCGSTVCYMAYYSDQLCITASSHHNFASTQGMDGWRQYSHNLRLNAIECVPWKRYKTKLPAYAQNILQHKLPQTLQRGATKYYVCGESNVLMHVSGSSHWLHHAEVAGKCDPFWLFGKTCLHYLVRSKRAVMHTRQNVKYAELGYKAPYQQVCCALVYTDTWHMLLSEQWRQMWQTINVRQIRCTLHCHALQHAGSTGVVRRWFRREIPVAIGHLAHDKL